MRKRYIRVTVMLLVVVIMVSQFSGIAVGAQNTESEKTVVVAGSDFQSSTPSDSARKLGLLLDSVKTNSGFSSADGFLFCGDYSKTDRVLKDNIEGVKQLKNTVSGFVPDENIVLAQGNHDYAPGMAGMSPSGNNDPASGKYGVFVINEDDYMWYNSDEQKIIETSRQLEAYLDDKIDKKFSAPIFVVSHLQLHASMRTQSIGDGKHANYIFDVLNSAGERGLNIVFLFGHNHGDGWDDYLGGSSIYLAKGDEIVIAHGSMSSLTTETLNFYYLNAGYVGYYTECNEGADCALTLTSFVFDDKTLEISRYDVHRAHNLKSMGVINAYKNEQYYDYYTANTDVYISPQVIELSLFEVPSQPSDELVTEPLDRESDTVSETADASVSSDDIASDSVAPVPIAVVAVIAVALVGVTAVILTVFKRKRLR